MLKAKIKGYADLPLELIETAINSRFFTAIFSADDKPAQAAGQIIVGAGAAASSLVSVEYADPTGGSRVATARLQTTAQITIASEGSSTQVRVGDLVTVTVFDGDRNQNYDQPDEITVAMQSHSEAADAATGSGILTLVENAFSSGIFTGTIGTAFGERRADDRINCEAPFVLEGSVRKEAKACACREIEGCLEYTLTGSGPCVSSFVRAEYEDPSPIGTKLKAALALKFPGSIALSSIQVQVGSAMNITVQDADLNSDQSAVETVAVVLRSIHTNSTSASSATFTESSILLREAGPTSSSFTASVLLCEGCSNSNTALNVGTQNTDTNQLIKRSVVATFLDGSHIMNSCTESCEKNGQCSTTCSSVPASRSAEASVMDLAGMLHQIEILARVE